GDKLPGGHAVLALRHVVDGGPRPCGGGPGPGRGRVDVRAVARGRLGLPARALRDRPAGRRDARGGGPAGRTGVRAGGASVVPGRAATGRRGARRTQDRAPVQDVIVSASAGGHDDDEEMPKMGITRERALIFGLFVISAIAFLYVILPQLGDVKETWGRLDEGDPYWLAVAFGFQLAATFSYIAIFQDVHVPPGYPITYRESYQIMMATLAATRLLAAARSR